MKDGERSVPRLRVLSVARSMASRRIGDAGSNRGHFGHTFVKGLGRRVHRHCRDDRRHIGFQANPCARSRH
jgi:hypothetical protein